MQVRGANPVDREAEKTELQTPDYGFFIHYFCAIYVYLPGIGLLTESKMNYCFWKPVGLSPCWY